MTPSANIQTVCTRADEIFRSRTLASPDTRADILDSIAAALDARRAEILTTTADETALTIDELTPEFARMTGTLRMFATLVRDGSWVRASIDTPSQFSGPNPDPNRNHNLPPSSAFPVIGPNTDLRKLLIPLGPVAVFGASNFPLAYGACGGDTASALAAGCPIIVKEHPAHPHTGRLLASIAQQAIRLYEPSAQAEADFPPALLQYIHNEDPKDFTIAQQLVQNRCIAAVGFTGSIPGGLAIEKLARERHLPVPVYAEMGSINPVIIMRHAMRARGPAIASELATSVLARHGQQCTKPGLIVVSGRDNARWLYSQLAERFASSMPRRMLAPWIADAFRGRVESLASRSETHTGRPALEGADSRIARPFVGLVQCDMVDDYWDLHAETFGPATIVVGVESLWNVGPWVYSSLTTSIYADESDLTDTEGDIPGVLENIRSAFSDRGPPSILKEILQASASAAGRIIFNGPPTGVRVATSTVHGGPFPATNAPHTTAVGPLAIERWCRPICYQNCPDHLLPPELQNSNPRGLWRTINGELTRSSVS